MTQEPIKQETKAAPAPKKAKEPKPVGEQKKLVTNVTTMAQWIGGDDIMPGQSKMVDVSPGSMGEALVKQGVFVEGRAKIRTAVDLGAERIGKIEGLLPLPGGSSVRLQPTEDNGLRGAPFAHNSPYVYACPFCGHAEDDEIKAQSHILSSHSKEILHKIADMVE